MQPSKATTTTSSALTLALTEKHGPNGTSLLERHRYLRKFPPGYNPDQKKLGGHGLLTYGEHSKELAFFSRTLQVDTEAQSGEPSEAGPVGKSKSPATFRASATPTEARKRPRPRPEISAEVLAAIPEVGEVKGWGGKRRGESAASEQMLMGRGGFDWAEISLVKKAGAVRYSVREEAKMEALTSRPAPTATSRRSKSASTPASSTRPTGGEADAWISPLSPLQASSPPRSLPPHDAPASSSAAPACIPSPSSSSRIVSQPPVSLPLANVDSASFEPPPSSPSTSRPSSETTPTTSLTISAPRTRRTRWDQPAAGNAARPNSFLPASVEAHSEPTAPPSRPWRPTGSNDVPLGSSSRGGAVVGGNSSATALSRPSASLGGPALSTVSAMDPLPSTKDAIAHVKDLMERRLFKDAGNYQEATDGLGIWDYGCDFPGCTKSFKSRREWATHVLNHRQQVHSYPCSFPGCGEKLISTDFAWQHARSHRKSLTRGRSESDFVSLLATCPYCFLVMEATEAQFGTHQVVAHGASAQNCRARPDQLAWEVNGRMYSRPG